MVIAEFISRQNSLTTPSWAYESYLEMRSQRRAVSSLHVRNIHTAVPITSPTPPAYQPVSTSSFLGRGPSRRSQRTSNHSGNASVHSYRSFPPTQVDSQGYIYGTNFQGGYHQAPGQFGQSKHDLTTSTQKDPNAISNNFFLNSVHHPIQTLSDR